MSRHIIKNFEFLANTPQRKFALELIETGLRSLNIKDILQNEVFFQNGILKIYGLSFSLSDYENIYLISIGKCGLESAKALLGILGEWITAEIVLDIRENPYRSVRSFRGTHPYPSADNVSATYEIIRLLKDATDKDLVIFTLSGGGSTLLCQPFDFPWEVEKELVEHLYQTGAPIREINTVRKHFSTARGGFLAKYAHPAAVVSLIISDVPGNDLQTIASGPTLFDPTTIEDAKTILKKYRIEQFSRYLIETPKEKAYFENVKNILILSNLTALEAMAKRVQEKGLKTKIVTTALAGEASVVGKEIALEMERTGSGTVLLYGGETTVTNVHMYRGGRNMELVLSALPHLKKNQLIASVATDGLDNSDYGGAVGDWLTLDKAAGLGLNPIKYLEKHASYPFFTFTGDFLLIGNTGLNVADLMIGYVE